MRQFVGDATVALVLVLATAALSAQQPTSGSSTPRKGQPAWAYGIPRTAPPGATPAAPAARDESLKTVPGSTLTFTLAQILDRFGPADWFPGDHPTMPDIVARGKKPNVEACGLCHYPNGKGKPENAGVSGLPVSYFIQTMYDFKNDLRTGTDVRTGGMNRFAKGLTDAEIQAAAEYFGAIKWTPWIRVVETSTVPKTYADYTGLWLPLASGGTEPIGMRIVETPENAARTLPLRDPRSGFIAYAPVGSIKKGEALVKTGGGGRTVACAVCHGTDLKGLGPVPGLAGRSPSYTARQLYNMQQGTRKGVWADLMKPVVAKLTEEDLVSITAYTASLAP